VARILLSLPSNTSRNPASDLVSFAIHCLCMYLGQFVLQFCYKIMRSKPTVSMLTKRM
jgi:hypothetical protein